MNKTIKLLTVVLVLTTATQSFSMWQSFANRFKSSAQRSWTLFKSDIKSPRQIALKSCAGVGAAAMTLGAELYSAEHLDKALKRIHPHPVCPIRSSSLDGYEYWKRYGAYEEQFKKWSKKQTYLENSLAFTVVATPFIAAGLVGGPIGLVSSGMAASVALNAKPHRSLF